MKTKFFYLLAGLALLASCEEDEGNPGLPPTVPPTPTEQQATVVLNEVNYGDANQIELYNPTNAVVDLSEYWLCLGPGQYLQLQNASVLSGNTALGAGEFLVVEWDQLTESEGLGLYNTNTFANPDAIVDFVQWGAAGSARENVAVAAGIWTAGEFVPNVTVPSYSIAYDGEGDAASDWTEAKPTLGLANDAVVPAQEMTTFDVTITNTINYLAAHVFNTPDGASAPGPIPAKGGSYSVQFKAVPGARLSFATMSAATNDWFFAPVESGINLFENGAAVTGDISNRIYLWDAGTEEEDPATIATVEGGGTAGNPDDDTSVRVIKTDVTPYLRTELAYDAATRYFTLTLTNIAGAQASTPIVLTPGLVVLHAQNAPLFTVGQEDRGYGLKEIAEAGVPGPLYDFFTEVGDSGAPLRLSTSISVLSPAVVYAFGSERDPWFTQGEAARAGSGVEEIAEDGNNQVAYEYLKGINVPVAKSEQTAPVGPGESLTFTLTVPKDQAYKFGFGTMLVQTNDWFISYNNAGFPLFDENGTPYAGTDLSSKTYLYDSGTEVDEAVGFGIYQAPRQSGPNVGPVDQNTIVRRVGEIEDVQFGKGLIQSAPGVTWSGDPRGGYNFIEINIQPRN